MGGGSGIDGAVQWNRSVNDEIRSVGERCVSVLERSLRGSGSACRLGVAVSESDATSPNAFAAVRIASVASSVSSGAAGSRKLRELISGRNVSGRVLNSCGRR